MKKLSTCDPHHPVFVQAIRDAAHHGSPNGVAKLRLAQCKWAEATAEMEAGYFDQWRQRDAMAPTTLAQIEDSNTPEEEAWREHAMASARVVKRLEASTDVGEYVRTLDESGDRLSRRYGASRAVNVGLNLLEALAPPDEPGSPPRITKRKWDAATRHVASLASDMDNSPSRKKAANLRLQNLTPPSLSTDCTDPALLLAPRKKKR